MCKNVMEWLPDLPDLGGKGELEDAHGRLDLSGLAVMLGRGYEPSLEVKKKKYLNQSN